MEQRRKNNFNSSLFHHHCPHVCNSLLRLSSISRIVALSSLYQDRQSVGALIGTHLTLCVAYLGIDLFKYRRMSLFLLQSYDHAEKRSNNNANNNTVVGGGEEGPPPSAATKINSDCSITYVPGVKQENWVNVLGDIRNYKGRRKPMSPILSHEDEHLQMIDGVPVIKVGNRANTNTKISLASLQLGNESNQNNISIPRLQSANTLRVPQRRGSAADASKLMKNNNSLKTNALNNSNYHSDSIGFSRGKSAIDLRKYQEEDQTISFNRTLTQAQISGIARKGKDKLRGNIIEDQNGKIRERIIIRRKRSAPNKESLSLPGDFNPEQQLVSSSPPPPPLEKIHESSPAAQKPNASIPALDGEVTRGAERKGDGDSEEEDVIKITRSR
jgi:hypothetical protein